jgi:hypothetical protein
MFNREEFDILIRSKSVTYFVEADPNTLMGEERIAPLECAITVESDWPEYDALWGILEGSRMPDISMCAAVCPVSRKCLRHADSGTVPDARWQSYGTTSPTDERGCPDFLGSHVDKVARPRSRLRKES